ncbi:peptidylprolyl isomerase [Acidithiobacillus thiooxidans]|jgi:peptidyl-prolyl cis-trans isomerase C|uniref:peptidylprolyl isomerase n=1 Tax=Acidithiobacillus thiooxidans TaxID=930 RepID=UPI001C0754B9|nr:peptidyl-prolyl cis-trans isomerase [Acidithiobacillus thiooxidans]MBU2841431.1 hypothetical protein [Acidithiobacillus thiooxidans]
MRLKSILLMTLLATSSAAFADNLAKVDGTPITQAQVDAANPSAAKSPATTQETLQNLINRTLLLQAAKKAHIEESPTFQQALENEKGNLLVKEVLSRYIAQHPASKEEIKARYEQMVKTVSRQQYRLREIVVPNFSEAVKIMHALKKGDSFSNLAAEHSSGPNPTLGGETGWLASNQIPAGILAHIDKIKTGEVVGPISVPEGFAIVQLLQERHADILPLDSVSNQLASAIDNQKIAAYLKKLRSQAKIEITSHSEKSEKVKNP